MCKKQLFFLLHLSVKIDLVEEVYYLQRVFHLLYHSVAPADALLSLFYIIDNCVIR